MKLLVAFLLFQTCSYGQNIVGKWKLISFHDEKMYYDIEKDSVYPKNHWNQNDSILVFVKNAFRNTSIELTEKKYFTMKSLIVGNQNSKFDLDEKNKIITLNDTYDNQKIKYIYSVEKDILNLHFGNGIILRFRKKE